MKKIKVWVTVAMIVALYLFGALLVLSEQSEKRTHRDFMSCPLCGTEDGR